MPFSYWAFKALISLSLRLPPLGERAARRTSRADIASAYTVLSHSGCPCGVSRLTGGLISTADLRASRKLSADSWMAVDL
jgi:hypothetical protein